MSPENCGVDTCPALASNADGFCAVHVVAKRFTSVMSGAKYTRCRRPLVVGDWVTRESTLGAQEHAACPPRRPSLGRKVDREKLLLETEPTL